MPAAAAGTGPARGWSADRSRAGEPGARGLRDSAGRGAALGLGLLVGAGGGGVGASKLTQRSVAKSSAQTVSSVHFVCEVGLELGREPLLLLRGELLADLLLDLAQAESSRPG